uniref:Uncharacterized protein n=1 Tax=Romanomermis culicivorax TaxID=13658 RepID=A0A915J296_ROMCU
MNKANSGNGAWWFIGGYGTATNRSSFYWYRNVFGYPETYPTLDAFWSGAEPNNALYSEEFILSINTALLNDLPARYSSGFVCQVDPSLPLPPNNNLNGSISSIPSLCNVSIVNISNKYQWIQGHQRDIEGFH